MKCKYRKCQKPLDEQEGEGRKRMYCNDKCKRMEFYFMNKESKK